MCHADGQFTEVDFPVVDDMCGCIQACLEHPSANSYQYNSGGWCGCLANSGNDLHMAANSMTDASPGACALCSVDHIHTNVNNGGPVVPAGGMLCTAQSHLSYCPGQGR